MMISWLLYLTGGKVLLSFKQQEPSDHVNPNEILKALGIEGTVDFPEARSADTQGASGSKEP